MMNKQLLLLTLCAEALKNNNRMHRATELFPAQRGILISTRHWTSIEKSPNSSLGFAWTKPSCVRSSGILLSFWGAFLGDFLME